MDVETFESTVFIVDGRKVDHSGKDLGPAKEEPEAEEKPTSTHKPSAKK